MVNFNQKLLIPLVSALAAVSTAQTSTTCNPLKQGSCKPNKALGKALSIDFREGESDDFKAVHAGKKIKYDKDGAKFTIESKGDNPTLQSKFYIMYGHVEAQIKAAPGTGIVSSFVLQSDDLDEVDLEWLGSDKDQVQSNYFSKGETSGYQQGKFHSIDKTQDEFHNYTIEWNDDQTVWYIDGNQVRSLSSDADGGYPQSPMSIRIGSWAGGDPSNPEGTIQWAGGKTNYGDGPFNFYVQSLYVQDYSTGDEYSYSDKTGKADSIKAKGGKVLGNKDTDQKKLENFHSQVSETDGKTGGSAKKTSSSSGDSSSSKTDGSSSASATTSGSKGGSSSGSSSSSGEVSAAAGGSSSGSSGGGGASGSSASETGSSSGDSSSSGSSTSAGQTDGAAVIKTAWSLIGVSSLAMALFI